DGLRDSTNGPGTRVRGLSVEYRRSAEEALLQGTHRPLLPRRGLAPAAQVEGAGGREQQQLVGGRPVDVARLTTASLLGLLHRALDRDREFPVVRRGANA